MLTSLITALHLAALSKIESGDHDRLIGPCQEVSRYQITPDNWNRAVSELYAQHRQDTNWFTGGHGRLPANPVFAAAVAAHIWQNRVDTFRLAYQRNPNLKELYLCWHRPGRVLNPKKVERLRARRFANLVEALTEAEAEKLNNKVTKAQKK